MHSRKAHAEKRVLALIGTTYARLTVVGFGGFKNRQTMALCKCTCGTVKAFRICSVKDGSSKSCGCLHRENTSRASLKHGLHRHLAYRSWYGMINRCYKVKDKSFSQYGAKGISVCDRWRNSLPNFIEDMGERPGKDFSLDRIDYRGNYEPSNCRWLKNSEQHSNTSFNIRYLYKGNFLSMNELCEMSGLTRAVIRGRLIKGVCENCLFIPWRRGGRKMCGTSCVDIKNSKPVATKRLHEIADMLKQ